MYIIRSFCPRNDTTLGAHYFSIEVMFDFRTYVHRSGLTQEKVNYRIKTFGNDWLDACGFNRVLKAQLVDDPSKETVTRIWEASSSIRVNWGEWGPEHISVPGNACGLDIDKNAFGRILPGKGITLSPHNIDSWMQKNLLLIVFTKLAEDVIILGRDLEKDHEE